MARQTPEQIAAVQYWLDTVRPPSMVHKSLRANFQRSNLTPEWIRADADAIINKTR